MTCGNCELLRAAGGAGHCGCEAPEPVPGWFETLYPLRARIIAGLRLVVGFGGLAIAEPVASWIHPLAAKAAHYAGVMFIMLAIMGLVMPFESWLMTSFAKKIEGRNQGEGP